MAKTPRLVLFECMECGKKFYDERTAERASMNGCPKCGGVDIDVPDWTPPPRPENRTQTS